MNFIRRLVCLPVLFTAMLLPATVWPGDEDLKPAYMIYIDPETGKYTHDSPDTATQIVAPAKQALTYSQPESPSLIVTGIVLAALLVVALVRHQRKQVT